MTTHRTFALTAMIAVLVALPLAAEWPVSETKPISMPIYRIKDEGLQRSKVMEIESYLTDVYGPRLTGSPNIKEAADWAQKTMKDWGLTNVHLETFPFGRGWQNQRFVANAVSPRAYPLTALPKAWTPGTQRAGHRRGGARRDRRRQATSTTFSGKLRGKFVLDDGDAPRRGALRAARPPLYRRRARRSLASADRRRRGAAATSPRSRTSTASARSSSLTKASPQSSTRAHAAMAARSSCSRGGSRDPKDPAVPPEIVLAIEQYGRISARWRRRSP